MATDDLNELYELFDQLIDLNTEQRQAKLDDLRRSGSPFVAQLESLLGVQDQTGHSTDTMLGQLGDKLPLQQWLQAAVESTPSTRSPSDLRDLVGLFRWDQTSKQFYAGDYRIGKCLAFNSHSATYFAEDTVLGRRAVITFAFPRYLNLGNNREQFLDSAKIVSDIAHPNVATILGVVRQGPLLGIARQWIPGHDLAQWLHNSPPLSISSISIIIQRIAEGLSAIHQCGALHGDLKPANIIMRGDRAVPVITDFGTVFRMDPADTNSQSWRGGTPGYIAPEILQSQNLDARFDLFSLGKILDELLIGTENHEATTAKVVLLKLRDELIANDPAQRPLDSLAVIEVLTPITGLPPAEWASASFNTFSKGISENAKCWTRRSVLAFGTTLLPFYLGRKIHQQQIETEQQKRIFIPGTDADSFVPLKFREQSGNMQWYSNTEPLPFTWECFDSSKDFPNGGLWYLKPGQSSGAITSEPLALPTIKVRYNTLIVWVYFNAPPGGAVCQVDVRGVPLNNSSSTTAWQTCARRQNYLGGGVRRNLVGTIAHSLLQANKAIQFRISLESKFAWSGSGQPPLLIQIEQFAEDIACIGQLSLWYSEQAS